MEFWKVEFLRAITASAGEFVCADDPTLARSRGGFARVCLRVNLRHPLRPGTRIQGLNLPFWQQFAFENLEGICSSCASLHLDGPCSVSAGAGVEDEVVSPVYGPWLAAVRHRRADSGSQREERRKSHPKVSPCVSEPASASHPKPSDRRLAVGEAGGWSTPIKVARRRVPASSRVVVIPDKSLVCSVADKEKGCPVNVPVKEAVPGLLAGAGLHSSEMLLLLNEKGSSSELGPTHSQLNQNPFASLGLGSGASGHQYSRDACPGPLKRARPVDSQAPRSSPKAEKRKGKAKASTSKSIGVSFGSPDKLTLPSYCLEGARDDVMACPVRAVGMLGKGPGVDNSGLRSGSLSLQSAIPGGDSDGLKADTSMCHEDGTLTDVRCPDTAMAEDLGGVPVSHSL